ncbi:hypothetical protein ABTY61_29685 [Kitasatospora sp. NPDC096128]|uniref:hypothetical protein n=1 Tax=Kitasatospora sp. NPDC096128 TaxID=3155547 RepID=UPI00331D1EA9
MDRAAGNAYPAGAERNARGDSASYQDQAERTAGDAESLGLLEGLPEAKRQPPTLAR